MLRRSPSRDRDRAFGVCGFLLCLALALGAPTPARAALQYLATNLGTPMGATATGAQAAGINNAGEIVGFTGGSDPAAFLYTPSGGFSYLPVPSDTVQSFAYGVNDRGEVVGLYKTPTQGVAFAYTPGAGVRALGSLGTNSAASAVNDFGEIAGVNLIGGNSHAVAYFPSGRIQDLGTLPGGDFSAAVGVSDRGELVGMAATAGDIGSDAFAYTKATGMVDLGHLPGITVCTATGVNDAGEVVGYCGFPPTTTGFEYTSSTGMTALPTLPGGGATLAAAINNFGQIVGYATAADGSEHAVLYTRSNSIRDLGIIPGGTSGETTAISANGMVAGDGGIGAAGNPPLNVALWKLVFVG